MSSGAGPCVLGLLCAERGLCVGAAFFMMPASLWFVRRDETSLDVIGRERLHGLLFLDGALPGEL
jgi:hypothetical protein